MKTKPIPLPLIFLLVRAGIFLSLPVEGLVGYGDLEHFFGWASLDGWPFIDYWMEFPPVFPLVAESIYRLAGGREHAFYYQLAILFTAAQAANIWLFQKVAARLNLPANRGWVYLGLLAGLFYGWAYFDPLVVFSALLGLYWALNEKGWRAALSFGAGALVKWFPLLGLGLLLRSKNGWRFQYAAAGIALVLLVWGGLFLVSPDFASASVRSQGAKGSWETPWAILDGNLGTGNFGQKDERYDPELAIVPQGSPARIPPWITLIPFALLGLWVLSRADLEGPRAKTAFLGTSLVLFFLWSPGWSPQWVLYLLPFALLLLPFRTAVLLSVLLVLVNLLEWPLLLSRGMFQGLLLTIPLRTLLLLLLGFEFYRIIPARKRTRRSQS